MKFAHLADSHLGYRQYGLEAREKDLIEEFDKIIEKIIDEDVDFVIHSGDLFQTAKPSPNALLPFQKGLLRLKGAGIPMYAIAGNHDSLLSSGAIPPQVLFKKFGLKLISTINTNYVHNGVFIGGIPFMPSSHKKSLKNSLANLSSKAEDYDKAILVLHQGIDKYLPFAHELEIGDLPDNFDYYALGHIHKFIEDDFGKGKLVYPGSMDILSKSEYDDYVKNGKGFVVVDLDGPKPTVKRVPVNPSREFIRRNIDFNNLENDLKSIKLSVEGLDKKPMIFLNVYNVDRSIKDIHELISAELGPVSLNVRTVFKFIDEEDVVDFTSSGKIGPKELLEDKLKEFGNESIVKLGVDLYNKLSINHNEEAVNIARSYFENNFDSMVIDNDTDEKKSIEADDKNQDDDFKITFKEAI
ncbi:MAG: DNA repair exonuclease [Methanobrevibacter sp.]|uniref:metallophosphoesterase family protein n=1 Tax=Methanobrevibacter sp. TaxID=66852 RepID=UPI0026DF5F90|nr:DNA repair exonuclease [Methanobrevibacter sp.]MDO5849220.1 DNA repair exonuclease [Methanobrevibacter sp.]